MNQNRATALSRLLLRVAAISRNSLDIVKNDVICRPLINVFTTAQ
jgi:hypothetical protein